MFIEMKNKAIKDVRWEKEKYCLFGKERKCLELENNKIAAIINVDNT